MSFGRLLNDLEAESSEVSVSRSTTRCGIALERRFLEISLAKNCHLNRFGPVCWETLQFSNRRLGVPQQLLIHSKGKYTEEANISLRKNNLILEWDTSVGVNLWSAFRSTQERIFNINQAVVKNNHIATIFTCPLAIRRLGNITWNHIWDSS